MSHPDSLERRDTSLSLVARFPEREEYVLSSSEFQRVKSHLLKLTNARAGVVSDVDEDNGSDKPTLKRRQPEQTDTGDASGESSSSDKPPQLKKKNEPQPAPSPTP